MLSLYAPSFNKKDFIPKCVPCLPASFLPTTAACQIVILQIANIFGASTKFIFSEGLVLPENRQGDTESMSCSWIIWSKVEYSWIKWLVSFLVLIFIHCVKTIPTPCIVLELVQEIWLKYRAVFLFFELWTCKFVFLLLWNCLLLAKLSRTSNIRQSL